MSIGTRRESVGAEQVLAMREALAQDRRLQAMRNAVTSAGIEKVALSRDALLSMHDAFSEELALPAVTNQMKSGRCWMFAGLNLLRRAAAEHLKVEEFELSQNYLTFFEKLEKANGFLEDVLATAEEPKDSRITCHLFASPAGDGGEWELFANLVRKYGVVPQWTMPETFHSSDSRAMNRVLDQKLREDGLRLREALAEGSSAADIAHRKELMLGEIFRILTVFLGLPPTAFDLEYRDKDKAFHREAGLTPRTFLERCVPFDFDAYQSVVNVPAAGKPFGRTYVVERLPVVRGGPQRPYLNVDAHTMRDLALRQVQAGEGVYFGCDVAQMMDAERGLLVDGLYDLEGVLGVPLRLTKAERLDYGGEIAGGHQMVLVGVDLAEGRPLRWKVENSWGAERGRQGYFLMSDGWLLEYVYQVVVRREYLPQDLQAALSEPPIVLPPWDPMRGL